MLMLYDINYYCLNDYANLKSDFIEKFFHHQIIYEGKKKFEWVLMILDTEPKTVTPKG